MDKKESAFAQLAMLMAYVRENGKALGARRRIEELRATLALANMGIARLQDDPARASLAAERRSDFDHAMTLLTRAKWLVSQAMEAKARGLHGPDWKKADLAFRSCKAFADSLTAALATDSPESLAYEDIALASRGTEIEWAGEVPLIPEIQPVVLLSGSDEEMGRQYALQLAEIFGAWILERKAGLGLTEVDIACQRRWEEMLARHAPEFMAFSRGFSAGARSLGVNMSYEEALDIWTGHKPPVKSIMGLAEGLPRSGEPLCSGIAAWGSATADGKLVAAASGDHDPGFTVTIVAFPESGHPFVYTPFGATGDVAKLGPMFMTGHPGMNAAGLAYVEHGGEPRYIEPRTTWGYGLRKGAAVMHILRFAGSVSEAMDIELGLPVGDVGSNFGSAGGFWADSGQAVVLESRKDPLIVRKAGDLGEKDFLYANNSACHESARKAEWMLEDAGNWVHEAPGGWRPKRFTMVKKLGGTAEIVRSVMRTGYHNSHQRNAFAFAVLDAGSGRIDADYLRSVYRLGGTLPEAPWRKATRGFMRTGAWGRITLGHASNALVALMRPRNDGSGSYEICVGPLARGLAPMGPTFTTPIRAETNETLEITLSADPSRTAWQAAKRADALMRRAGLLAGDAGGPEAGQALRLLAEARRRAAAGDGLLAEAGFDGGSKPDLLAKGLREHCRAQVRAKQAISLLAGPYPVEAKGS
jgi:hypothetical protein